MNELRQKPDRRTELLTAARAIFAEKDFEAATVSEIVAKAGVAQGTFYLYFSSKLALVIALNQELNEHILLAVSEAVSRARTAAEIVSAGISAAFQELGHYRDILNVIHSRMTSDQIVADWEQQFGSYYHLLAEMIRQRQTSGEVDHAIHPEIAASLIVGLIHHAADECYIYHPEAQPEVYIAELIRFVKQALNVT